MFVITILGNTVSKKNSRQIIVTGDGRRRVVASKPYLEWERYALLQLRQVPLAGKLWRYPLRIKFHYVRTTRRPFDYNNMSQGPLDVLQQAGIIADDDMMHVIPIEPSWSVDKNNPRVEITITEAEWDVKIPTKPGPGSIVAYAESYVTSGKLSVTSVMYNVNVQGALAVFR